MRTPVFESRQHIRVALPICGLLVTLFAGACTPSPPRPRLDITIRDVAASAASVTVWLSAQGDTLNSYERNAEPSSNTAGEWSVRVQPIGTGSYELRVESFAEDGPGCETEPRLQRYVHGDAVVIRTKNEPLELSLPAAGSPPSCAGRWALGGAVVSPGARVLTGGGYRLSGSTRPALRGGPFTLHGGVEGLRPLKESP